MDEGMTVAAGKGREVQVRKAREGGFTEEKKQIVLDHLAGCANLTQAAAAAEISAETVNYHRRNYPAFAQAVEEALAAGCQALRAAVIAEAAAGGRYRPGTTPVPGAETIDTELALQLLRLQRPEGGPRTGRAGQEPRRVSEKELNDAILAKLDVLDRRLKMKRCEVRKLKGGGKGLDPGLRPSGGSRAEGAGRSL